MDTGTRCHALSRVYCEITVNLPIPCSFGLFPPLRDSDTCPAVAGSERLLLFILLRSENPAIYRGDECKFPKLLHETCKSFGCSKYSAQKLRPLGRRASFITVNLPSPFSFGLSYTYRYMPATAGKPLSVKPSQVISVASHFIWDGSSCVKQDATFVNISTSSPLRVNIFVPSPSLKDKPTV